MLGNERQQTLDARRGRKAFQQTHNSAFLIN